MQKRRSGVHVWQRGDGGERFERVDKDEQPIVLDSRVVGAVTPAVGELQQRLAVQRQCSTVQLSSVD